MLSKQDILHRKQLRDDVVGRVRDFFVERGYIEFETPLLVPSPGMEPNLDPFEVTKKYTNPVSEEQYGLITSPEYAMKKLLGAGFEKIFTITPVFRNNETKDTRHLHEFPMLEFYAPGNYDDLLNETEQLFEHVLQDDGIWPRVRFEDADVDEFGDPRIKADRFFITNYPAKDASLARLAKDGTAERFEAFAQGLELCNGFVELTDPVEQRKRFEIEAEERRAAGKTVFPIDEDLLQALGNIKKSVYGNAVGIDRLIMVKNGIKDVRSIQVFPS